MTRVVHCKKEKYDVYIGRPSPFGNPFVIGPDGDRDEVVRKYEEWLMSQPDLLSRLPELKGKILGCWCKPNACHGDVLAKLADNPLLLKERQCEECGGVKRLAQMFSCYCRRSLCNEHSIGNNYAICEECETNAT